MPHKRQEETVEGGGDPIRESPTRRRIENRDHAAMIRSGEGETELVGIHERGGAPHAVEADLGPGGKVAAVDVERPGIEGDAADDWDGLFVGQPHPERQSGCGAWPGREYGYRAIAGRVKVLFA